MESHTQRLYTFGTWNVRGLSEKKREAFSEIRRESEDVVVLTETKLRGVGQEEYGDYIHLYSGINAGAPRAGVSILLKKELATNFTWESVNERLIKAELHICGRDIVVIGVYWVDECATKYLKDRFQSTLKSVLESVNVDHELILLGDFNSRVGTDTNSSVVGRYGESEINNNGRRLIEICKKFKLKIQNTFFNHEDKHKYTWYHARQSKRTMIDFCITRQNTSFLVEDVLACRWLECGTDHVFVEATLSFQNEDEVQKVGKDDVIDLRKYQTYMLYSKTIRIAYKDYLESEINVSVPQTTEEMYQYLKANIHSAAFHVLGLRKNYKVGEFLWDQEIRNLHEFRRERNVQNKTENIPLESKFTESQFRSIKNEVWEGICSTIDNADKHRRNKIIWNILSDFQNKSSRIEHGKKLFYETIRKTDKTESPEHSVNSLNIVKEPSLDNFVHVDITDVCNALNQLEDCNSTVPGGLNIQLLKYSSNKVKVLLTNIIQNIFNGEEIPTEITELYCCNIHSVNGGIYIPHQGKCFMHSIMRVMGVILKNMLERCPSFEDTRQVIRIEPHLDATFILRQILQKSAAKQIPPFHFVLMDLGKSVFEINVLELIKVLEKWDIPNELIAIIKRLYQGNNIRVVEFGQLVEKNYLNKGLVNASLLFTLLKMYLKEEMEAWKADNMNYGIKIDNERLLSLFLTDSKLLIFSESKKKMQKIITSLKHHLEKLGLSGSLDDVKYLCKDNLEIANEVVTGEEFMNFYDFIVELDARNIKEVFKRILDTKEAIGILHPVARDSVITQKNKKRIFTSVIRSLLLYGCETWTITVDLEKHFEDTELSYWKWCCENYPRRYTKQEIYDMMNIREGISRILMLKKAAWYTRIMQVENLSWTRRVLYWKPEGTLKSGRPRKKWVDGLPEFLESFQNYPIYFQKHKQVRRSNMDASLRNALTVYEKNQVGDIDNLNL